MKEDHIEFDDENKQIVTSHKKYVKLLYAYETVGQVERERDNIKHKLEDAKDKLRIQELEHKAQLKYLEDTIKALKNRIDFYKRLTTKVLGIVDAELDLAIDYERDEEDD